MKNIIQTSIKCQSFFLESGHVSATGSRKHFRERFAGICASERGGDMVEVNLAVKRADVRKKHPLLVRSRFWIDSVVLGTRSALKEHAADFWGEERAQRKKFGRVYEEGGAEILSLRQLMVDVN